MLTELCPGRGALAAALPAGLLPYMGKLPQLPEKTAGISERDVTAYNSPRIWMKKFHFFLSVGFETSSANVS